MLRPDQEYTQNTVFVFCDPQTLRAVDCGWLDLYPIKTYHWLHIKSGKEGIHQARFTNEFVRLQCLNHWNKCNGWKYWED